MNGRRARTAGVLALAVMALGSATPSAQSAKPTSDVALALARAYLLVWQNTLVSLVADEELSQEVNQYPRRPASGRIPTPAEKRRLRSELLLLRAPAENIWLAFRDVIAVDGRIVNDRQKRFDALFSGPAAMMLSTAARIEEEGFRFNLGSLKRTINSPLAALVFLEPRFHANTKWDLDSNERLNGHAVWQLHFEQSKPPFAVKVPGEIVPFSRGSFWLDPDTGAILKWDLRVRGGTARFRVTTTYGTVPSIAEGLVPVKLEEEYDAPPFERLRGVATYSNHRLFRTGARIITPSL